MKFFLRYFTWPLGMAGIEGNVLGALVVHAVEAKGQDYVAAATVEGPIHYRHWNETMRKPKMRRARNASLPFLR